MSVRACKGSPLRILGPSRWQLGFAEPGLSRAAVGVPPLRKSKIDTERPWANHAPPERGSMMRA